MKIIHPEQSVERGMGHPVVKVVKKDERTLHRESDLNSKTVSPEKPIEGLRLEVRSLRNAAHTESIDDKIRKQNDARENARRMFAGPRSRE